MASLIIHIAITNELNKKLKRDKSKILIGTIAPDISKLIGETRLYSHFKDNEETSIPNIDKFLKKYKNYLNDDFVLGYYIHLYVDYLWFKYFIPEVTDGTKVKCTGNMISTYIYNDYTNLNIEVINRYNLDLKIFYNDIPKFKNIIKEIPMDKIDLIVNQTGLIIMNSKKRKEMVINMEHIENFIDLSIKLITSNLRDIKVLEG